MKLNFVECKNIVMLNSTKIQLRNYVTRFVKFVNIFNFKRLAGDNYFTRIVRLLTTENRARPHRKNRMNSFFFKIYDSEEWIGEKGDNKTTI